MLQLSELGKVVDHTLKQAKFSFSDRSVPMCLCMILGLPVHVILTYTVSKT